jgi:serpin B
VLPVRGETALPHLSIDLLTRLVTKNAIANVVISPYSLTAVLGMLETGAAGETRSKLRTVLGLKGDKDAVAFRERQHAMLADLRITKPQLLLQAANGEWNSPHLTINPDFVAALRADFGAEAAPLDFSQPSALTTINDWVRKNTDGAIPILIDELSKETLLVLANALHFKAKWSVPFDPAETRTVSFQRADGTERPTFLMSRKGKYSYYEGRTGQAVRLGYAGDRFAMTLLLPPKRDSRTDLTPTLVTALLRSETYNRREGTVAFPRLGFNTLLRLSDLLAEIGLGELFGKAANYRGISTTPFSLTQVIQRIAVNVDETGTEAAAATAGFAERRLGALGPFTMICDRPFYFIIDDAKTGAVLLIAHIGDPAP